MAQLDGSVELHPRGTGIHVWCPFVDGKTWKYCGGVPAPITKVDQVPALPAQDRLGANENGVGSSGLEDISRLETGQ